MTQTLLHVGGASTASVVVALAAIFLLMLIMSFAFWRGPQGLSRWSGKWLSAWASSSAPRIAVAGAFCAGLFVASSLSSGSNATPGTEVCDTGLPPLTAQPLTDQRIISSVEGLGLMQSAARDGDLDQVRVLIFSDTHSVSHDVDAPLRSLNQDLAIELCRSIVALEFEIAGDMDLDVIVDEAGNAARLMEEARALILESSPFDNLGVGAGACDDPIEPITDLPVTRQRLQDAADRLSLLAAAADRGDIAVMPELFFGDAHSVAHDVDGPLRDAAPDIAIDLCLDILELEIQLSGAYQLSAIEESARSAAALFLTSVEALELGE
jgi:hypothetical protein